MFLAAVRTTKHKREKKHTQTTFASVSAMKLYLYALHEHAEVQRRRHIVYIQMPHIAFLKSQECDTNWKVAQNPQLHLLCTFM